MVSGLGHYLRKIVGDAFDGVKGYHKYERSKMVIVLVEQVVVHTRTHQKPTSRNCSKKLRNKENKQKKVIDPKEKSPFCPFGLVVSPLSGR